MLSNDGLNDFASVMNVTFKGMELAGSFGKNSLLAIIRLCKLLYEIHKKLKEQSDLRRVSKLGKISNKTMHEKYGDSVVYKSIQLSRALYMAESANANKKLTDEQIKNCPPTEGTCKKRFDKLAKKYGLNYTFLPNFVKDEHGNPTVSICVPKGQEHIFAEVIAQFNAQCRKEVQEYLKQFPEQGTPKTIISSFTEEGQEIINNPGRDSSKEEYIKEQMQGITEATEKEFNEKMKETFADYEPNGIYNGTTEERMTANVKSFLEKASEEGKLLEVVAESKKKISPLAELPDRPRELFETLVQNEIKHERSVGKLSSIKGAKIGKEKEYTVNGETFLGIQFVVPNKKKDMMFYIHADDYIHYAEKTGEIFAKKNTPVIVEQYIKTTDGKKAASFRGEMSVEELNRELQNSVDRVSKNTAKRRENPKVVGIKSDKPLKKTGSAGRKV